VRITKTVLMMRIAKALNWASLAASGLIGVLGLAFFGLQDASLARTDRWWLSFIAASALFAIVPFLALAFALLHKRRLAAISFLAAIPIFARWAYLNASYASYLSHLYTWFAGLCFVLGLYWLLAWWRDWPALLARPIPIIRGIGIWCFCLITVSVLDLAFTFGLITLPYGSTVDCGLRGVFSRSTFGHDAVFTAHIIRVGHQLKMSDGWVGNWAIARVQERFWGWRFPHIVFLTSEGGLRSGDDYLIDGRRPIGALTRFLPIVEIRHCNRTQRLVDAGVEIRVLRSGFPTSDVRIMGRVDRWVDQTSHEPYAPQEYTHMQGAKVEITGPPGTVIATTDGDGIYDVAGLPPGKYEVHLESSAGLRHNMALMEGPSDLQAGEVAIYSFSFRPDP
jgi:hypothetical protein